MDRAASPDEAAGGTIRSTTQTSTSSGLFEGLNMTSSPPSEPPTSTVPSQETDAVEAEDGVGTQNFQEPVGEIENAEEGSVVDDDDDDDFSTDDDQDEEEDDIVDELNISRRNIDLENPGHLNELNLVRGHHIALDSSPTSQDSKDTEIVVVPTASKEEDSKLSSTSPDLSTPTSPSDKVLSEIESVLEEDTSEQDDDATPETDEENDGVKVQIPSIDEDVAANSIQTDSVGATTPVMSPSSSVFESTDMDIDELPSLITCSVHPDTAIPNSDASLRILRKFIMKTSSKFPSQFGGTKVTNLFGYLYSFVSISSDYVKNDECCLIYKELVDILADGMSESDRNKIATAPSLETNMVIDGNNSENTDEDDEDDVVIESILGHSGDTMSKARLAIAAFCTLIEIWSLQTKRSIMMDDLLNTSSNADVDSLLVKLQSVEDSLGRVITEPKTVPASGDVGNSNILTPDMMSYALACAEALVAHGCFDRVLLVPKTNDSNMSDSFDETVDSDEGEAKGDEPIETMNSTSAIKAVNVMVEAIFQCDISTEKCELTVLKLLLTCGCRNIRIPTREGCNAEGDTMLRGNHLLQTLRVCYRVYLKTLSDPNKTTARAALRQIVSSTFARLEKQSSKMTSMGKPTNEVLSIETDPSKDESVVTTADQFGSNDDPFGTITTSYDIIESVEEAKDEIMNNIFVKEDGGPFPSLEHKDAYLVFRALCKLSMKNTMGPLIVDSIENTPGQLNDPALDSKTLALDLLLEVLQRADSKSLLESGPQLIYAVRNYLCHSLLKNCTSNNTAVINLSLRLFVPLIRHLRSHLKSEIEAFLTNVFFVLLSSKNSTVEHKTRVVVLFEEICSDSETLAEIFLNYDCDLSAVDLFQRIVNTLATVAKIGLHDVEMNPSGIFVGTSGATRAEKMRQEHRQLRLEAMQAMKQILSSLHECIVTSSKMSTKLKDSKDGPIEGDTVESVGSQSSIGNAQAIDLSRANSTSSADGAAGGVPKGEKHGLVKIFDSKRKRREEIAKATLRFNQKPSAGIRYASDAGIINGEDAADVAQYLLSNQDELDKTQIGEYLGREPEYQEGFSMKVLHEYLKQLDFSGLLFDEAIRFYLSGFRLPGEAQKIDRIMEKFAERFTTQNPDVFPTADAAFILAFSVIMLNTDLHNPAIKEERRMTKEGFIRNNRGICDGKDLPSEFLNSIFDRIKQNPISLKEDDEARERVDTPHNVAGKSSAAGGFFSNHYVEMDKKRESDFQRERDQMLRNTESLLRQKKKSKGSKSVSIKVSKDIGDFVRTDDSGLKDEYVTPMFDVTWGPALAVFSTAMESANGTMGFLLSIASDKEIELAAENAASATEVCLDGFRLAIRIAALCGNDTARSAFVHALSNFSLLGTGSLMEHRHVRCVQTLLEIGRDEGELLGKSWEYVFKALSEVARLNSVHEVTTKASRVEAEAKARRKKKQEEAKLKATEETQTSEMETVSEDFEESDDESSLTPSDYASIGPFDTVQDEMFQEEMDKRAIDETNARTINENIPEDLSDSIYHKSATLSAGAVKDFIFQLCRVSRMEISGYGGHVGNQANDVDLTAVHYRQQHTLLTNNGIDETRYNQPDIYSLQKLVEVTHYNMDYRPRLVFADIWSTVSGHLTSTALHSNAAVAMYAVDSFRQLSTQFLKREELGVFEFQRKFLKPFESVMLKCQNASIKEFLLKSVEQIILLFGSENQQSKPGDVTEYNGLLRSGWRPILTVIGIASRDTDDAISNLGFNMLTAQLRASLNSEKSTSSDQTQLKKSRENKSSQSVMRADRFVDLVDTLLMYVSGPREDKSALSIDHLVTLSRYLSDDSIPFPQKTSFASNESDEKVTSTHPGPNSNEILELWWPILLGLSKAVGDSRPNIRIKALVTLLSIINQHFFPSVDGELGYVKQEVARIDGTTTQHEQNMQTLQLIFRGILTPILEHAETTNSGHLSQLPLPEGFIRYMTKGGVTKGGRKDRIEENNNARGNNWLDTTFDHLMDGSISLAMKCIELHKNDVMVEEVLAMFNNCLISDSGPLAVRGLRRLNHFITCDLALEGISNDTWATVCHMLRRCLTVRGVPTISITCSYDSMSEDQVEIINDFVREEQLLAERRYIGSNATSIIGNLLSDKQYSENMGMQWQLFLLEGLGIGLKEWDRAASIMSICPSHVTITPSNPEEVKPPQYAENALYGRKWMVRLLLKLMTNSELFLSKDTLPSGADGGVGTSRSTALAKKILKEECEAFITSFRLRESIYANGSPGPIQSLELEYMTKMTCDLLDGMCKLDDSQLKCLSSLTPTLTACIQINDRSVRTAVQNVLQRLFDGTFLA